MDQDATWIKIQQGSKCKLCKILQLLNFEIVWSDWIKIESKHWLAVLATSSPVIEPFYCVASHLRDLLKGGL